MPRSRRVLPKKGQESVWDYPTPPAARLVAKHIEVWCGGERLADTRRAFKVMETGHPPIYFVPREDVRTEVLRKSPTTVEHELLGTASHFAVRCHARFVEDACWTYPDPAPGYAMLADCLAFYPRKVDRCVVDGEDAAPQPGDGSRGWVTSEVVGPFKGEPGAEDL